MKYEDWFNEGIRNKHLKHYTLNTMKGLLDNVEVLKQAYTQSVKDKLGKDLTDKMKEDGDFYWLNILLNMMTEDEYWNEKII
tara:strand:+ start:310 stop:555 length:246 start_codon:yes stop_codon:yes gene_type:complete